MVDSDDFDTAGLARIQQLLDDAVAQQQAPGVVAAVAAGSTVHVATAGVLTVDGPAVREDSLFRITSMTKPMTAAVVVGLVEDGLLRFDDAVEQYVPELADRQVLRRPDAPLDDTVPADRPFTVRDLLTFTWGMGMQGAMFLAPEPWPIMTATQDLHVFGEPVPDAMPDPDAFVAGLARLPLMAQPGERWLYSSGSLVLGVVVARATGKPFDVVMQERLFEPLGMSDTAFWTSETDRLATAYSLDHGDFVLSDPPDGQWSHPPAFPDGAAGLVSTARDVVAFGRMLLRGGAGVLRPEMAAEMVQQRLTPEQRTNDWGGFDMLDGRGWGYGVSVLDSPDEGGRYSWDGGFGTSWSNVPDQDLTVVVLTQRLFDEAGPPAVCADVLAAAREAVR